MLPNSLDEQFWNFFRDSYARITANHVVTHTNFYWVEKIISRFCYVNLKRILFRWLVRHRLTLYAQSYPLYFLISLSTSPLHDEHRNIETLSPITQQIHRKGISTQAKTEKLKAQNVTQYRPIVPNPKHVLLEKCMALDTKPAFFTATFQTRHYYALKEEIPSKTCSWEQSFQEVKDGKYGIPKSQPLRNCEALSILANVTSYQVDLLFGKISFQDLCFNFVPIFRRYLTPQCSCLMKKNECIVFSLSKGGWFFLNTCM